MVDKWELKTHFQSSSWANFEIILPGVFFLNLYIHGKSWVDTVEWLVGVCGEGFVPKAMRNPSLIIYMIAKPSKWREQKMRKYVCVAGDFVPYSILCWKKSVPISTKGSTETLIVFPLPPLLITKVQVIASRINKSREGPKHYQFGPCSKEVWIWGVGLKSNDVLQPNIMSNKVELLHPEPWLISLCFNFTMLFKVWLTPLQL